MSKRELKERRSEERYVPPLMIMRTITHSGVHASGKDGGTGEALPRENHVRTT